MSFGGIDLGGTKIEARYFDADMSEVARHRIPTPIETYDAMVAGIVAQVRWLEGQGALHSVGLGVPGLVNPLSGEMLTANLPATGRFLARDLAQAAGRAVPVINDCRAFTLSEAVHGAGAGYDNVAGLVIGTGVAGGIAVGGRVITDANGQHGEFGHLPLGAELVAAHDLPLIPCGCGLTGCFESYVSGPGLTRLAELKTGAPAPTKQIMIDPQFAQVRAIWVDLIAGLVAVLTRTIDPQVIVLGGGLGTAEGVAVQISAALPGKLLSNTTPPVIVPAQHGDASGALGAAVFAREVLCDA